LIATIHYNGAGKDADDNFPKAESDQKKTKKNKQTNNLKEFLCCGLRLTL